MKSSRDEKGFDMNDLILIAYFSRAGNNFVGDSIVNLPVGNTEVVAKMIAQLSGGELFKIDPVNQYSTDYTTCTKEAQKDLRSNARPELVKYLDSIAKFNTIILGYPNYWSTMPMPVFTFLEKYDFSGKTILPFCTHEGSGLGNSERDIAALCPEAKVLKGLAIRGSNVNNVHEDVVHWLRNANLID
jgi:flavodoxin